MHLNLTVAIVTSYYIFRCPKVSILIENIYISNLLYKMFSCRKCQEHMISHFQNRYVPRSLPCPPPLILHCIVIYSSHHNALINGARVLHSRPLPSLSWSRLTYMSYMRRTVYNSRRRKVTQTVLFSKKLANRKRPSAFSCQTRAKVGVRVTTFIVTMGKDSKHQHQ